MTYEFEDVVTGERVEREYPIGSAPSVGKVVSIRGRKLRRVLSCPAGAIVPSYEATCLSFGKREREAALAVGCKTNQHGEVVMQTRTQRDEIEARTGLRFNRD